VPFSVRSFFLPDRDYHLQNVWSWEDTFLDQKADEIDMVWAHALSAIVSIPDWELKARREKNVPLQLSNHS
jgi:hypothetical protein